MTGFEVVATGLSKVYAGQTIVNPFSFHFQAGSVTGISGPNGSGKSTLIRMLCGFLTPSSGSICYQFPQQVIKRKEVYQYVALAAPYSMLIKDFDLEENYLLFRKFKVGSENLNYKDLLQLLEWKNPGQKVVAQYSSGMQQKVNLLFAMLSGCPLLLLDEPTSYLDEGNKEWYHRQAEKFFKDKTVIIASNDDKDFMEASNIIKLV
ncbi:MAG: ATP-binding cassette domain-containing protein [Saprospiraceae bacterium]|nr:ATP-binding cassette domain-containing protein [Saprospiraceae bacterium]MBK8110252.1 ATP-binding cassette domain-containing protein [Saprospiraceae bacterium]MBK9689755.1 ATP-binding cassette domain-containing protein [Saprospiraceae bacterium]MBL0081218.1 ATP-binding cassette domain-containing protein [Saprospiraceae bacterium]